jgi:Flp pilus assembly protein TadD
MTERSRGGRWARTAPLAPTRLRPVALPVLAACALVALAWHVSRSDSMAFLSARSPPEWIVYPRPGDTWPHLIVELDAEFSRSFQLASVPPAVPLRLRAFRAASVRVNGVPLVLAEDGEGWKGERRADAAQLLRAGDNEIVVTVSNDLGPPALWLALQLPAGALATDASWRASWAGATPRPASPATEPMRGSRFDPLRLVRPPFQALVANRVTIALFATISALAAALLLRLRARTPGAAFWAGGSPWPLRAALAVVALLWSALVVNNAPLLPATAGFDASGHLEYVQYLLDRHAVPLADQGWQMFQPPLYYALAALAFSLPGVGGTSGPGAAWAIRGLGLATGLAHLWILATCLRRLLPDRPRAQVLGLLVGGFLPCMLYMHQLVGNEPLVAALSSGAILTTLVLLQRDSPGLPRHVLLGLLLGLALLAKVSALLLLPPVLGVLAWRAVTAAPGSRRPRVMGVITLVAVMLASCGWYFARVWLRFGTPLVGGWDAARGFGWWQDPGFRTAADFLRFGRAFAAPVYAGFGGFWDGLYVTLWGDGLLSGRGDVHLTPHWWSLSLMSAGYALAIVPCAAAVAGAVVCLVAWLRRPRSTEAVPLVLAFLVLLALAFMVVQVPSVVSDKASYGMLALVSLGAFAGRALDRAAGARPWSAVLVAGCVGAWGLTSYATHWIDAAGRQVQLIRANDRLATGDTREAVRIYYDLLRRDPDDWAARLHLATIMLDNDAPRRELAPVLERATDAPEMEWRYFLLSRLAERYGDLGLALATARRAVALDPDQPDDVARLAELLARAGDRAAAIATWREVLRIDPQDRAAHLALAQLLDQAGDGAGAAVHRGYASRIARAVERNKALPR